MALRWCPHPNKNFKSNPNPIQNGSEVTGGIGYTIQCLPRARTQWLRVRRPSINQTSFLTLRHGRSQLRPALRSCHQTDRLSRSTRPQFQKLELFAYRSTHELITTAILKIRTQHQWTHAHFHQVLQNKYDPNHHYHYHGYSSWEAHEFCGLELQYSGTSYDAILIILNWNRPNNGIQSTEALQCTAQRHNVNDLMLTNYNSNGWHG